MSISPQFTQCNNHKNNAIVPMKTDKPQDHAYRYIAVSRAWLWYEVEAWLKASEVGAAYGLRCGLTCRDFDMRPIR